MIILNFFDLNKQPDVDYYKASLTIRNIIYEILDPDVNLIKINIINEEKQDYINIKDNYDLSIENPINVSFKIKYT